MVVANAMLLIIGRALNMLKSQIEAQGKAFEETGGFSERLTAKRTRSAGEEQAPGAGMPTVRQAHAPAQVGERPVLGLLRFPGVQRHKADRTRRTALTGLTGMT